MNRVFLHVYSFNAKAKGLYKKIGFKEEGTLRQSVFRNSEFHDTYVMSILKSEYKSYSPLHK